MCKCNVQKGSPFILCKINGDPFHVDEFFATWYNQKMKEVIKAIIGFVAIIIVGLAGVTVSNVMKLGEMNATIITIDNITQAR
ncbi:MAG: hypothetical protein UU88_C0019G0006 [Parcubacteria group bacterium GW2011_GWC1_42_11]|uniref:Uncharacterized protein n=1 Tax=Candidatus Nomurabacteria bacterium GW2011_GWC2_42_20 TaxID=1618756 RepID=A0A0G0ZEX5_9BACT|nr:MAG: hypothetical protein UU88_C0019G0006 [Parcubacteria group bacterium GW2011_GWC1_42_11]KKS47267.1 MAG: hypothetical protein UV12_C0009G0006 [Candidatus Nomurabacteria bacterium GW2011_GWC2_42_20]KKS58109.1 MAG: hypothetical protein UV24_C0031G0004 [Candidatus Nomurabacteria bacterium GW2011_GWA2_42_41]TAN36588.1 MAG: hypothetical protein EPN27_01050 [Patescibacteria group bacterium]HBH71247.1 hypothetical protein [Candidatus Yonathbacteria bacterium]